MCDSEIKRYYSGRTVFITGCTGFIGKVIVEKLVRVCCDVKRFILLIRPKKGQDFTKRCTDYLNHLIFDNIRKSQPELLSKIVIIRGNMDEDGLGLNQNDYNDLIKSVSIILHCAANVRFDQTLHEAVHSNVLGTFKLLEMSKKFKQLEAFVYVSTAYSQCGLKSVEEKSYGPPIDPHVIIRLLQNTDVENIQTLLPKVLGLYPNPYAFSKAISENLVYQYKENFPIVIVRPSIVTAAILDPLPGYCEGLNGLNGYIVATCQGVLRTALVKPVFQCNLVPVDIVANTVIAGSFLRSKIKTNEVTFYNVAESENNCCNWNEYLKSGIQISEDYPFNFAIWTTADSLTTSIIYHTICFILFQMIPSLILDGLLILFGKRPMLVRAQRRIKFGLSLLDPYVNNYYAFETRNFHNIQKQLNSTDCKLFDTDRLSITGKKCIGMLVYGTKKFVLKEKDEDLPKARRYHRILDTLDGCTKTIFWFFTFIWCSKILIPILSKL